MGGLMSRLIVLSTLFVQRTTLLFLPFQVRRATELPKGFRPEKPLATSAGRA